MVIGNFALLAKLNPQELHEWYLGVYIDAFEWVEAPNTLGMSQSATGNTLATKPYVSSAAYLHKMGNACATCHYKRQERYGEDACPFNALYWNFFVEHKGKLQNNPRLGMVYRQIERMNSSEIAQIQTQAAHWFSHLEEL
jgi:deoxyribodipyrimidine photolyase-related protein